MINIRSIRKLGNNDGLTLKMGKKVNYKSGWQVATEGIECKTAQEAIDAVRDYGGNCGVWYSEGIYYIDKEFGETVAGKVYELTDEQLKATDSYEGKAYTREKVTIDGEIVNVYVRAK